MALSRAIHETNRWGNSLLSELNELSATETAHKVLSGEVSSEEVVQASVDRIEDREQVVRAWKYFDPEMALSLARRRDDAGTAGPLYGIPVGIKDQFDTADMPTGYGSPIYEGYRPAADAEAVARLRAAGAVVMGKTKCTELCTYHPTDTTNPLDPTRTPGGSSSGSAAAVADFMVPVAIGTQTVGSTIRPASFCGVFGYKPTFGSVSRAGALSQCHSLDTVGFFARTVENLELIVKTITRVDPRHASVRVAQPVDFDLRSPEELGRLRIAFARTPWWHAADKTTRSSLENLITRLGDRGALVDEVALPAVFDDLIDAHNTILEVELSRAFSHELRHHPRLLSEGVRDMLERGRTIDMDSYVAAQRLAAECRWASGELFINHDVLLAPSARGEAPVGLGSTGDPIFCRAWTLLGLPCVSFPGMYGPDGLPLGAQIVGPLYGDGLALSVARWVSSQIQDVPPQEA